MASKFALALTLATASSANVLRGQSVLENGMQPEVVARTLSNVQDEWRAQADVFAECSATSNLPGASIVNCADAPSSFGKSCGTVVTAIIQGSGGDKDVAKEYMADVCTQKSMSGWHQNQCNSLATAVRGSMSVDKYSNRVGFDSSKLCTGFWSKMVDGEKQRLDKEKAEHDAEEKKAAEEAAEDEKKAEEERKKEADRKKVEEAERVKQEAQAKAVEAAAKLAQKKAEAAATQEAAEKKMEEAKVAEQEQVVATKDAAAKAKVVEDKKAAVEVKEAPVAAPKPATVPVATAPKPVAAAVEAKKPVAAPAKAATPVAAEAKAAVTAKVEATPVKAKAAPASQPVKAEATKAK